MKDVLEGLAVSSSRPFWGDDPSGYVNGDLGSAPSEAPINGLPDEVISLLAAPQIDSARAEGIAAERERIEHDCEMIAVDWRDDGQEQKWWAFQYLRDNAIREAKP